MLIAVKRRRLHAVERLDRALATIDRVKTAGRRPAELASIDANSGKSAAETAAVLGISQAQVERIRAVQASDDEAAKAAHNRLRYGGFCDSPS